MSIVTVELELLADTERYLETKHGRSTFWFTKQTLAGWRVEGDKVSLSLEEKAWKRRLYKASYGERAEPKAERKARNCLCCGNGFTAERFMFVCQPCKGTTAWRMGGTAFC